MREEVLRYLATRCGSRWCIRHVKLDGLCGKHWCDEQDWEYAIHLLKERGVTDPDRHTIETMRDKIRKEESRDKDSWWEGFFWGLFWGD